MSKKLSTLIFCLVILSGTTLAAEKVKFSMRYESYSQINKLGSKAFFLLEEDDYGWQAEMELTDPRIKETGTRLSFQASYSLFSWLTVGVTAGVEKMEIEFSDIIAHRAQGHSDYYRYSWEEKLDPVISKGEMVFFCGLNAEIIVYKNSNSKIALVGRYINQQENLNPTTFFEETLRGYWDHSSSIWYRKVEIEKTKSQKLELGIILSGKIGKTTLTIGPQLLLARTDFQVKILQEYHYVNSLFQQYNDIKSKERESEFRTKNKRLCGIFTEISYAFNENVELSIRATSHNQMALAAEIGFKF